MRVRIVQIHPQSALYPHREEIVGLTGNFTKEYDQGDGWFSGRVRLDSPITLQDWTSPNNILFFFKVRLKRIPDERTD